MSYRSSTVVLDNMALRTIHNSLTHRNSRNHSDTQPHRQAARAKDCKVIALQPPTLWRPRLIRHGVECS